jgi:Mn-dependent transcriptional regulator
MSEILITKRERDCLLAITENSKSDFPIRLSDLANILEIKPPTALNIVKRLSELGLVRNERGMIRPTEKGVVYYKEIIYHHRVLECILKNSGVDEVKSCVEAAKLDYQLPHELVEKMEEYAGNPRECPHGKPIEKPKEVIL